MSIQVKIGGGLLQKEKIIQDLQKENEQFKIRIIAADSQVAHLKSACQSLERSEFEIKNAHKLLEIENGQMQFQIKTIKQELLKAKEELAKQQTIADQKQVQALNFQDNLEDVKRNMSLKSNKLDNYMNEVQMQEKRNQQLDSLIQNLKDKLEERDNDIEILKKSIKQKDHHIAILLKEKERIMNNNDNNSKEQKSSISRIQSAKPIKEPACNTSAFNSLDCFKTEDQLKSLKSQLQSITKQFQEAQSELKKVKEENFTLITRLKNARK